VHAGVGVAARAAAGSRLAVITALPNVVDVAAVL
jgi:hypothetical protein